MARERLTSDLDLNTGAPTRTQPKLGAWGPSNVPTTRSKRRWRWLVYLLFLATLALVMGLGYYGYTQLK